MTIEVPPGYESLAAVLGMALEQAAYGKGAERHATDGEPFDRQQICQIPRWQGNTSFPVGQVCKKALESERLPKDAAIRELLGAINFAAAAAIVRGEMP